jgi:hypothetical protein
MISISPTILGLDISTSYLGWSLLALDSDEFSLGYLHLANSGDTYAKAQGARELLRQLHLENNIQATAVEEDLQRFKRGLSSAKTLATLARFNGVVCQLTFEETNLKPERINVNAARKLAGVVYDKKDKTRTTKEKVLEAVQGLIDYDWPTRILKSGKRKGLEVFEQGCFDMCDAWVIARAAKILYLEPREG